MPEDPPTNTLGATPLQPCDKQRLVEEHIAWMLTLSEKILNDHALAQDTVQEAFLNAFHSYHTLRDETRLKPWLKRIVVNTALMQLRQIKRRSDHSIDDYLPEFDSNDCRIESRWSYLIGTEAIVENLHLQESVHGAFAELPDDYRIVLLLRDIEGYNTTEVASMLDISNSSVKTRLHRARAALKKLLEPILRGDAS